MVDSATCAWLKQELVSVLGFSEVDDIVAHILTSFHSKQELEPYLTELLGIPMSRTKTISNRLFPSAKTLAREATGATKATPLVPKPIAANSRVKQAKSKPKSTLVHSRTINCLDCGKIEYNGARKCSFCDTELRYEALDDDAIDAYVNRTIEEGSTVIMLAEQGLYDEVESEELETRSQRPITLQFDVENRIFTKGLSAPIELKANQDLPKESRTALQNIQKQLNKQKT